MGFWKNVGIPSKATTAEDSMTSRPNVADSVKARSGSTDNNPNPMTSALSLIPQPPIEIGMIVTRRAQDTIAR